MTERLQGVWAMEDLTDEYLRDLFENVAGQLTGLVLQVHADGRILLLLDKKGRVKHVVSNISRDNDWACFCPDALDGECPATTFVRARIMVDVLEHPEEA